MAGRSAGLDPVEQGVSVAVQPDLDDPLRVAAGGALAPQLGARAGVVVGLAACERLLDGLAVRVRERQHVARRHILGDDGHQAAVVELYPVDSQGHLVDGSSSSTSRMGIPALPMCSLTSAMLYSPKWKMLAARTAPAPASTAE